MATSEDYTPRSAYSHRLGEEEGRGPGSSAAGDFSVHPHPGATTAPSSEGLAGGVDAVTVAQKLLFINAHKLAGSRPVVVPGSDGLSSGATTSGRPGTACSNASSASSQQKWMLPSGPRKKGEGVENEEQGIVSAEAQPGGGGAVLRVTLLAAGFIIGPSGSSVREIMRVTGADIKSWTDTACRSRSRNRPCRVFVLEGDDEAVCAAMDIMAAAVDRYKELCEGRCEGQTVTRQQHVCGVDFSYQPPPRQVVPCAAALKSNITRPPPKPPSSAERAHQQHQAAMAMLHGMGLPGFMAPLGGAYLQPAGSPNASLPFPLYLTPRHSGFGGVDPSGPDFSALYPGPLNPAATLFDPTNDGSAFGSLAAMAAAAAAAGPGPATTSLAGGAPPSGWPPPLSPPSMANPYLGMGAPYGALDPASMMAYMSLGLLPSLVPPSPGGPFPPNALGLDDALGGYGGGNGGGGNGKGLSVGAPLHPPPPDHPDSSAAAPEAAAPFPALKPTLSAGPPTTAPGVRAATPTQSAAAAAVPALHGYRSEGAPTEAGGEGGGEEGRRPAAASLHPPHGAFPGGGRESGGGLGASALGGMAGAHYSAGGAAGGYGGGLVMPSGLLAPSSSSPPYTMSMGCWYPSSPGYAPMVAPPGTQPYGSPLGGGVGVAGAVGGCAGPHVMAAPPWAAGAGGPAAGLTHLGPYGTPIAPMAQAPTHYFVGSPNSPPDAQPPAFHAPYLAPTFAPPAAAAAPPTGPHAVHVSPSAASTTSPGRRLNPLAQPWSGGSGGGAPPATAAAAPPPPSDAAPDHERRGANASPPGAAAARPVAGAASHPAGAIADAPAGSVAHSGSSTGGSTPQPPAATHAAPRAVDGTPADARPSLLVPPPLPPPSQPPSAFTTASTAADPVPLIQPRAPLHVAVPAFPVPTHHPLAEPFNPPPATLHAAHVPAAAPVLRLDPHHLGPAHPPGAAHFAGGAGATTPPHSPAVLSSGKTPKRPSMAGSGAHGGGSSHGASSSCGGGGGGGAGFQPARGGATSAPRAIRSDGRVGAGGGGDGGSVGAYSAGAAPSHPHQQQRLSVGAVGQGLGGGHGEYGGGSGGGRGVGGVPPPPPLPLPLGHLHHPHQQVPMVSSEDPLVSPSRFNPRAQALRRARG